MKIVRRCAGRRGFGIKWSLATPGINRKTIPEKANQETKVPKPVQEHRTISNPLPESRGNISMVQSLVLRYRKLVKWKRHLKGQSVWGVIRLIFNFPVLLWLFGTTTSIVICSPYKFNKKTGLFDKAPKVHLVVWGFLSILTAARHALLCSTMFTPSFWENLNKNNPPVDHAMVPGIAVLGILCFFLLISYAWKMDRGNLFPNEFLKIHKKFSETILKGVWPIEAVPRIHSLILIVVPCAFMTYMLAMTAQILMMKEMPNALWDLAHTICDLHWTTEECPVYVRLTSNVVDLLTMSFLLAAGFVGCAFYGIPSCGLFAMTKLQLEHWTTTKGQLREQLRLYQELRLCVNLALEMMNPLLLPTYQTIFLCVIVITNCLTIAGNLTETAGLAIAIVCPLSSFITTVLGYTIVQGSGAVYSTTKKILRATAIECTSSHESAELGRIIQSFTPVQIQVGQFYAYDEKGPLHFIDLVVSNTVTYLLLF